MPESLTVPVGDQATTALLYLAARQSGACVVLAHGAGAAQRHPFMIRFAEGLARRGIDVVTFNFLYTEEKRRVPDRTAALEPCYRCVLDRVKSEPRLANDMLLIGGKSLGGRMASHLAAAGVEGVAGLVFLGYPLHPPRDRTKLRAAHLPQIRLPMLFVQGDRDPFGTPAELAPIVSPLGAAIHVVAGGDHALAVPKRGPIPQERVYEDALDAIAAFTERVSGSASAP